MVYTYTENALKRALSARISWKSRALDGDGKGLVSHLLLEDTKIAAAVAGEIGELSG